MDKPRLPQGVWEEQVQGRPLRPDFDGSSYVDQFIDFIDLFIRDGDASGGPIRGPMSRTNPAPLCAQAVNLDAAPCGTGYWVSWRQPNTFPRESCDLPGVV